MFFVYLLAVSIRSGGILCEQQSMSVRLSVYGQDIAKQHIDMFEENYV